MKKRWFYIPSGVIILVLFLVGTFFDLNIAKAIAHTNSSFTHIMASFLIYPLSLVASFFGGTFIRIAIDKEYSKRYQNILLIVFGILALLGSIFMFGYSSVNYLAFNISKWFILPIGLAACVPGGILGIYLYKYLNKKNYIQNVIFVALTIGIAFALYFILSRCVYRARYTSVINLPDYYRPWYSPSLSKEMIEVLKNSPLGNQEAKSFPSGHATCSFAMVVVLTSLPLFIDKLKNKEALLFNIGFIYYLFACFCRIYGGAHYLTDTMFSGIMFMFIYIITSEFYLYRSK